MNQTHSCHSERSEESVRATSCLLYTYDLWLRTDPLPNGFFAALRMTTRPRYANARQLFLVLLLSLTLLVAACDDSPVAPTPPPDPTSVVLVPTPTPNVQATHTAIASIIDPVLNQIPNASAIHIKEEWSGSSVEYPLVARISITRTGDNFTGKADFSAGHSPPSTSTRDLTLRAQTVGEFLALISISPVEPTPYSPRNDGSDEHPSISIELTLPSETVIYRTMSQGYMQKPWALDVNGNTYSVDSTQPRYALNILERQLGVDNEMRAVIRLAKPCEWSDGIC